MHKRNKSIGWALNQFKNRSLQGVSYRLNRGFAKPTRIIFCMTLRCNIKCRQCAIWRTPNKDELTTEEWKNVIATLRDWIGPCRVQMAGGEIFIRNDILDIIKFATEKGVLTGVVSNGTMITKKIAEEIVETGLGYIHISVDGIKPETHDYIRGIDGLYEKTIRGINYLVEENKNGELSIGIATVIMKKNLHELTDIVKYAENRGLEGVIFNPLSPTIDSDPDWFKKTDLWFDDLDEAYSVIDQLIDMKKNGAKILNPVEQFEGMKEYIKDPSPTLHENCWVGITNLSITSDGYVHTCFKMPPLGNVKESRINELWYSDQARAMRENIKNCDIHCSPGNFVYRRSLIDEIVRYFRYG